MMLNTHFSLDKITAQRPCSGVIFYFRAVLSESSPSCSEIQLVFHEKTKTVSNVCAIEVFVLTVVLTSRVIVDMQQ